MTVNKVILLGNLGRDPELKQMKNGGDAYLAISIATSESRKDKQTGEKTQIVEWHNVVFYGKSAEVVAQYLKKGDQIYVEGKLKTNKYADQNGVEKYSTTIIATSFNFVGSKKKDETTAQEYSKASGGTGGGLSDFIDDDVPF